MAQLLADRRDVDFVLHEQLNVDQLSKFETYAEFNKKTVDLIISEARNLAVKEMLPTQIDGDREGTRFENTQFTALYEDFQSYIWVGTFDHGVFRIDPATLAYRQFTVSDGLCDNNVISISARNQQILFSTFGGGISSCRLGFEDIRFENLTQQHPEIANYVYSTLVDSRERIWIAQDADRLNYLLNDSIGSYGSEDDLNIIESEKPDGGRKKKTMI